MSWKNKNLLATYENLSPKLQREVWQFIEYLKFKEERSHQSRMETRYLVQFDSGQDGIFLIEDDPN